MAGWESCDFFIRNQIYHKIALDNAVPKTEKHREMHFYEIRSLAELSEGRFGVREPKGGVVCIPKEGDLLLVPGLLFDGKKNRLGYGGGYYDTYFAKHKEGKRIGLA